MEKAINFFSLIILVWNSFLCQAMPLKKYSTQNQSIYNDFNSFKVMDSDTILLVKDINLGEASSSPEYFFIVNDELIFMAADGIPEGHITKKIWKSDGTADGTVMVKNIFCGFSIDIQRNINGTIFFGGGDEWELWKTDGTAEGTVLVKDILQSGASCPQKFGIVWDKLIFTAVTEMGPPPNFHIISNEIFISDGTTNGTIPLNIQNVETGFLDGIDLNKKALIFLTNKIYQSNESFEEISLLKEFEGWGINSPFKANDSLIFFSLYRGDGNTSALWRSNGTPDGTVLLRNSFLNYIRNFTSVEGTLFFTADDGINGTELWKSNGTIDGSVLVKDIFPGNSSSNPDNLIAFNRKLYFTADDGINGVELWESDGTEDGTFLIKDVSLENRNSGYANMMTHNNYLFFTIINTNGITELWKSDGKSNGTYALKNLTNYEGSSVSNLHFINNTLYFARNDTVYGEELWKYILPTSNPNSIESIDNKNYNIYPNPTGKILYFTSETVYNHVIITNLQGIVVSDDYINSNSVDVSFLSPGIYVISINNISLSFIKN